MSLKQRGGFLWQLTKDRQYRRDMTSPWSGLLPSFFERDGRTPDEARMAELLDTLPVAVLAPLPLTGWGERLATALEADDLTTAHAVMDDVDEPGARMWLTMQASQELGFAASQRLASEHPDDAVALTVAAAALVMEARESGPDDPDDFDEMAATALLEWADDLVARARELTPDDPTPAMVAQHCWRRADGGDAALARANQWRHAAPWSYSAYSVLLTQLGGLGQAGAQHGWEIALALSEAAPEGSAVHGLVPTALMERLIASAGEDPPEEDRPVVRAAVEAAMRRSVARPGWSDPWVEPRIRNDFAFTLYSLSAHEEALTQMLALDGQVTMAPWALMDSDDPTIPWEQVRASLVLEAYGEGRRVLDPPLG